jgi:hypothetical protein
MGYIPSDAHSNINQTQKTHQNLVITKKLEAEKAETLFTKCFLMKRLQPHSNSKTQYIITTGNHPPTCRQAPSERFLQCPFEGRNTV